MIEIFNKFSFLVAVIVFIILNVFYIIFTKDYWNDIVYKIQQKEIKKKPIYILVAFAFILIGWIYFIYIPYYHYFGKNIEYKKLKDLLLHAFILGIISYGVFNFNNLGLFDDYPVSMAIADTLWGGVVYIIITLITLEVSIGKQRPIIHIQ
jgi:uncharacterized membrane protein